jgi:hypothetical protein
MPAYILSPFKSTPNAMTPGMPSYLWGGFNDKTGPTVGIVLSDSGNGTTSTVVIKILGGNIPIVSALSVPLITIVGSTNASGAYNTTNAQILSISAAASPDEGVYTVTFAGTGVSTSAQDTGQFLIPQPEVAEVLVAGASAPVVMPYNIINANMNQALTAVIGFVGTLPTSAVINLQQAVQDLNSEYQNVAVAATVAGSAITVGPQITVDPTLGRFFRFNTTGLTGTGAVVAKLLL